ncbi:sensor domain-containing protein [Streptomyces sp. NPDC050703]|uniref:sensor histidine kinase n=1 Tax=Streptomyces sp. NPDC050703 TaxID=3157218 RepID=UPI00343F13DA
MRIREIIRAAAGAPFSRRARREAAYCLAGSPLGLVGGPLLTVVLALGVALTVSLLLAVAGALLVIAGLLLARALAGVHRGLAGALLGERTQAPPPFRPGRGFVGRLDARLRDGTGWRAAAYVLAKLPVGALHAYAVLWWLTGLVNLSAPVRWTVFGQHPEPGSAEGMPVVGPLPFGGQDADTFAGTWGAVLVGAVTLLCAPWVTRVVVAGDRWLIRALLGPGRLADRVRDLEETRALAVDDSVALLRRVERDLHDGAQVRLVAVAMSLDMVKEGLDAGRPLDVPRIRRLVDGAHQNTTQALTELRDLARGIHPPALDEGLPDALATLTARSSVPVELSADVPVRPTPAIETIAYFCAAELLANVIKHSGAGRAAVHLVQGDGLLRLTVTDDGHGGAAPGGGSGLAGLAQRVRTVDGRIEVRSPAGGPTAVTVELPLSA